MRQRKDFYTLCPGCEAKVDLTLAAKLQAPRAGCSCVCSSCEHEWVCIQEWIYRAETIDHSQPITTPNEHPPVTAQPQTVQQQSAGFSHQPAAAVAATQPPRPHLPTFQPPQPIAPPAQQQPAVQASQAPVAPEQQHSPPVPAPHAWSFERKTEQQPAPQQNPQPGYGR